MNKSMVSQISMVCAENYKLFTIVGEKVETDEAAEIC